MTTATEDLTRGSWSVLTIAADALDDAEKMRISTENRIRSLQQVKGMKGTPEETQLKQILAGMEAVEGKAEKILKTSLKNNPFYQWIRNTIGVGEKQAGRLLGILGDPCLRVDSETGEATPRTVSQLWAYCGLHVIDGKAAKRKKDERANWSSILKSRSYLIAESCMKQRTSPYRKVYDDAYAVAETKTHTHQCQNTVYSAPNAAKRRSNGCGTQKNPEWGEPRSPWRDGHKHAYALRLVAKTVLKDLWIEGNKL